MSKLTETKRAHAAVRRLLDQELLRAGRQSAADLNRFRETLDAAFYLLGWAQFEHLVRTASKERIEQESSTKSIAKHAWDFLVLRIADFPLRRRLEFLFHGRQEQLKTLHKDYDLRNEIAHNYKLLPKEVNDVGDWLEHLEDLADKLES